MWKCFRSTLLDQKRCAEPVKLFLTKRLLSDDGELTKSDEIKNRSAWSQRIQMLVVKREKLQEMSDDIQRQQSDIEVRLRLNEQQLKKATDEYNKLNPTSDD
ncbi:uncharacterized protein Dwil_GK27371 [Drosophila willistoni]|uniref:Uncharacterized protein n=1 Tax=Drosophila willistoni TaxID=7260 RepID=A0A0Q9X652_DROWI|nr:uncharacterized protein LOC26529373 [Drosophila willistoni]KRG00302.1 uncharacterized protein Dwil_GK27371 [Drosophila willistoni]